MDPERFPWTWRQRRIVVPLARALRAWFRPRVAGLDRVPADRPVVYVGKHPRGWLYLETILLGLVAFGDGRRPPFRTLQARGTLPQRVPGLAWLRRNVGAIEATAAAAAEALRRGESILVFPGGAREARGPPGRMAWRGASGRAFARIAAAAGAPIVPFAIRGADRQHPLRVPLGRRHSLWLPPLPLPVRLDLRFGAPIPPPPPGDRAAAAAAASRAAREVAALLGEGP